jgi:hypothetical protein
MRAGCAVSGRSGISGLGMTADRANAAPNVTATPSTNRPQGARFVALGCSDLRGRAHDPRTRSRRALACLPPCDRDAVSLVFVPLTSVRHERANDRAARVGAGGSFVGRLLVKTPRPRRDTTANITASKMREGSGHDVLGQDPTAVAPGSSCANPRNPKCRLREPWAEDEHDRRFVAVEA